jgi:hypothetical protein
MRGDEVRRLHEQLMELEIVVAADERQQALFGDSTAQAIRELQRRRGREETGIADDAVLAIVVVLVEERRRHHHHRHHHHEGNGGDHNGGGGNGNGSGGAKRGSVSGVVLQADGTAAAKTQLRLIRKRLRHELQLGHAESDGSGHYQIVYTKPGDQ